VQVAVPQGLSLWRQGIGAVRVGPNFRHGDSSLTCAALGNAVAALVVFLIPGAAATSVCNEIEPGRDPKSALCASGGDDE